MKNEVRQLVKNIIEENAVKFKDSTSKVLYSKVNGKLKKEYVNVSKNMFRPKQG